MNRIRLFREALRVLGPSLSLTEGDAPRSVRAELSAEIGKYIADMRAAGAKAKRSPVRRLRQFFADARRGRDQRLAEEYVTRVQRDVARLVDAMEQEQRPDN